MTLTKFSGGGKVKKMEAEIETIRRTSPIRGKIAKIISSWEVALNVGSDQGVEVGMLFDILSPKGFGVRDPETGEELGSIDVPKARVKVTRVNSKLSVASTYRTKRVNIGGSETALSALAVIFQPPKWETHYETLKSTGAFEPAAEELDEKDSYVAVGDPVVQVLTVAE